VTQAGTNGKHHRERAGGTVRDDGFLHRFLETGEVKLHVAEARPENYEAAPLVVLLHGFPEHWWSWRHQMKALAAAGYWAVAPDMRGYNESEKPIGVRAYEVERLAADVAGLIRALGRDDAIVAGHDWGAVVAWHFAMEHGSMLRRLAILNVPHPLAMMRGLLRPKQLRKSWYIFFFQLPGGLAERGFEKDDFAHLRRTFQADGLTGEEIERYIDALRVPGVATAAMSYYRAAVRRVLRGRLAKIRRIDHPVLVIWGEPDRLLGTEMAAPPPKLVPNARVVVVPNASHWVQSAAPDRVNELLLEFVRAPSWP
jgi:epoxide hydrolase 4